MTYYRYQFLARKLKGARLDFDYDEGLVNMYAVEGYRIIYTDMSTIVMEKPYHDESLDELGPDDCGDGPGPE